MQIFLLAEKVQNDWYILMDIELAGNFCMYKKMVCVNISGLKARRLRSRDWEVCGYVPLGML